MFWSIEIDQIEVGKSSGEEERRRGSGRGTNVKRINDVSEIEATKSPFNFQKLFEHFLENCSKRKLFVRCLCLNFHVETF